MILKRLCGAPHPTRRHRGEPVMCTRSCDHRGQHRAAVAGRGEWTTIHWPNRYGSPPPSPPREDIDA